jgi:SpoVK/Ycf46/Vps4 family AAA+-type ATPase
MANPLERLKLLMNSSTAIVAIETLEEVRALNLVRAACSELSLPVFEWNIADGLTRTGTPVVTALAQDPGPTIGTTREPQQAIAHIATMSIEAVFVLKDFHRHLDDPIVVRRLRDVAQQLSANRRTLIMTGPAIVPPPELANLIEYLELPLPDKARLRQLIDETFGRLARTHTLKRQLDSAGLDAVADNLRGLIEEEAERVLAQAIIARYGLTPELVTDVLEAKKSQLRRSGMLEFIDSAEDFAAVGGLENLKSWLRQRRGAWEDGARNFGLDPPRGVIIMGVQGCGKSMCARAIAGEWKLPLMKFETADIFDKYVGETEKRIQKLFHVAEELAPAVLWIDELEKVFAGSGPESASSDAGVSSRLLGTFLSWMQDRKAAVFVAATSNNVRVLPPELIRKGRFDELFFVDLPNDAERRAILVLQLRRHRHDQDHLDIESIVAAASGYSGAEIDAALQSALYACYAEKTQLTTERILQALHSTVPLSTTRAEEVDALREWARHRATAASALEK